MLSPGHVAVRVLSGRTARSRTRARATFGEMSVMGAVIGDSVRAGTYILWGDEWEREHYVGLEVMVLGFLDSA